MNFLTGKLESLGYPSVRICDPSLPRCHSVPPVSWSELLVQPVVAPPWLLAVTLPCRRRLHPSQPDRLGCLSVALIVSCVIRSVGRSGLTNSRHLPTHETCGQPSTVYLVVVNGRETELVLTNSLGSLLTRWNGSGPLHLDRHRRHTVPFHLVRHSLSSRLCRRTTSALLLPAYLTSLLPLIRYQFQCSRLWLIYLFLF